jgi:hypothetical protein
MTAVETKSDDFPRFDDIKARKGRYETAYSVFRSIEGEKIDTDTSFYLRELPDKERNDVAKKMNKVAPTRAWVVYNGFIYGLRGVSEDEIREIQKNRLKLTRQKIISKRWHDISKKEQKEYKYLEEAKKVLLRLDVVNNFGRLKYDAISHFLPDDICNIVFSHLSGLNANFIKKMRDSPQDPDFFSRPVKICEVSDADMSLQMGPNRLHPVFTFH